MESRFECQGNPKIKLQPCRLQNLKSLQSQNPHAARKRILLNGLEIVHGRLSNLTPADVYFGRGQNILLERERIKRQTIQNRRLNYRRIAA